MPNRLLREGILTSDRVSKLNDAQEVFYRRLMSVVDDFGRYYARPELILAACYPLALKRVSANNVEDWLEACEQAELLTLYSADDGKDYLMLRDFRQQVRARSSRYPEPPAGDRRPPPRRTPARTKPREPRPPRERIDMETGEIIPMPPEAPDAPPQPPAPPPPIPAHKVTVTASELVDDGLTEATAIDWLAHRKSRKAPLTHTAWNGIKREAELAHWSVQDACTTAMTRGWTGFNATWLENERNDHKRRANGNYETPYQRAARERMQEFAPSIAAKAPGSTLDIEDAQDVTFRPSH